jgi:hypothetical protein
MISRRSRVPLPTPSTGRVRSTRRVRLTAVVIGLLTAALTITPYATAQDTDHRSVPATPAQLAAAAEAVRAADVAGTAWYPDTASGRLTVIADSTVGSEEIARIVARIKAAAPAPTSPVHIRRTPGRLAERIAGGDIIEGPNGARCKIAFNVRSGSSTYALTAGHCTALGSPWSIGPVVDSSFPGNDYGLIQYTDPSQAESGIRGSGGTTIRLTSARTPSVGETVCARGSTTGTHCGTVLAVNVTVNYSGGGIVTGLIDSSLCSESGDSGGPVYSGSSALGIVSGGSGSCASGGETFFQPVVEALNAYGVVLL